MFEVGMSALVLKICSEYAKSLGLNFPPCTQQEINAICEWVDKHTIKDMTISQDGYNVTFTFKTENDVTKEFTFTIPKAVDIDELEKVLKGSDSVVVDRLSDNSGLQVKIAQSVLNNINNKLAKPTNPSAESAVTMLADGTVGTKPLSEIGGKVYLHQLSIFIFDKEVPNPPLVVCYMGCHLPTNELITSVELLYKYFKNSGLLCWAGAEYVSNFDGAPILRINTNVYQNNYILNYQYSKSDKTFVNTTAVRCNISDTVTEL